MTTGPDDEKVTPDEDQALRRLHYFEEVGAELAPEVKDVKEEIRKKDKRIEIREPHDPLGRPPQVPVQPFGRKPKR